MRLNIRISIAILLITMLIISTGCTQDIEASRYDDQSLSSDCVAFNKAVESDHPTTAVVELLSHCAEKLDQAALGKYLLRYEELMKEEKSNFSKRIFERGNHETLYDTFPDRFDITLIDAIESPEFRSTLRELVQSGYTLKKTANGLYEVIIDYSFFEKYTHKVKKGVDAYFELMLLEQTTPIITSDNKLVASPDEMKDRLLVLDRYIAAYPKSQRLKDVSQKANEYLLALVYGFHGVNNPYDDEDVIKDEYYVVYDSFNQLEYDRPVVEIFKGLKATLDENDKAWSNDVYAYIIDFPEIYRKRYLNANVYPDAFVDVGFGWTVEGDLYYYPVFTGIPNRSEQGKLNLLSRSIAEKRMLGEGIDGMYTNGNYIWTDYKLTFNRRNWISIKYDIYTELPDETYYWSIETLNYDLSSKRKIQLRDVLEIDEERKVINESVKAFFEESRTYYEVSLEDFYKNANPDFYLTNTSIVLLVPVSKKSESTERIVEIFIPFEKFNTSVEYIYKIHNDDGIE